MPPPPAVAPGITSGGAYTSLIVTMTSAQGANIYYRAASNTTTDISAAIDPDDTSTYSGIGTAVIPETFSSLGHVYRIKAMAVLADGRRSPETAIQRYDYDIDGDDDGLIEIRTLADLDNMRYSLDGSRYKTSTTDTGVTNGCPGSGCIGYELMNDLNFDADGDGSSWTRATDGTYTLDDGDNNNTYFAIPTGGASGGWSPIGDCGTNTACTGVDSTPFTAVFEGNGNTISNLATVGDLQYVGLFGAIGSGAIVRNVHLVDNLAKSTRSFAASVGGLAGFQAGGHIIACSTSGAVEPGAGIGSSAGGLVGRSFGGHIVGSRATGPVRGFTSRDRVGGLVGVQGGSSIITASYATSAVTGTLDADNAGGLVGRMDNLDGGTPAIRASYATGAVSGGGGNDHAGGLVGYMLAGSITGSYSSAGAVDGGAGTGDNVGSLAGALVTGATITASWGFGAKTGGETDGSDGSVAGGILDLPTGVTTPAGLTSDNVPTTWNAAANSTNGAWNFAAGSAPALNFADYDGSGADYHCMSAMSPPSGAIIIPSCGMLIPNQPGR